MDFVSPSIQNKDESDNEDEYNVDDEFIAFDKDGAGGQQKNKINEGIGERTAKGRSDEVSSTSTAAVLT